MITINKKELLNTMVKSANGEGSVYVVKHNNNEVEIWVNCADTDTIESSGVDVLYERDFSSWNNGQDLDYDDIDFNFDKYDIEDDLNNNGIEL